MEAGKKPNYLIREKSPYLLQHAYNPVNWHPWGEEAFTRSREEQKLIFLSIGYSTCHWCHVMERESFENDSIAAILNRHFVCIKVDREERPDVDKVYMTALQGMGQGGGWPLSMFLTPDLIPFYGGTYFPPETRYGRIGFPDLLKRIDELWENERQKVIESANGISNYLKQLSSAHNTAAVNVGVLDTCLAQISSSYDVRFGGFGGGPKFPRPVVFNFLLRYYARSGNQQSLEMTAHTLRAMCQGGMYDQVGGGFHRYSVDGEWRVPHFEKMLYDQAQLVTSLVDMYLITGDNAYAVVVRDTLRYVKSVLASEDGGFFSAEDADSPKPEAPAEEGEGAFYVWTKKELLEILGMETGEIFSYHYGVEEAGNALMDPQHEFTGKNILYVARSIDDTARMFRKTDQNITSVLSDARRRLLDFRAHRPRPRLDDKILASWNGLMISAFSRAYQALDEKSYLESAENAARFVLARMYDPGTRQLARRFRDGETKHEAHLDDYAFFVQGLLELYEASFDFRWLEIAAEITEKQIEMFWDGEHGGFFDTSGRDSSILVRMKEPYDGAEPSGNSIAAMNLLRLSQMTDNDAWKRKAERAISVFGEVLNNQANVMPQMACALDFLLSTPKQIVIVGARGDNETGRLVREVFRRYMPNRVILYADGGEQQERLARSLPIVKAMTMVDGKPTVYVCEDYVCQLPTSDVHQLSKLLDTRGQAPPPVQT